MHPHCSTVIRNRIARGMLAAVLLLGLGLVAAAGPVTAAGTAIASSSGFVPDPGPDGPPAMLGPYTVLPFGPDPRPAGYTPVTAVPGPTGDVQFSREGLHTRVGGDGSLWGHGYTGDVYYFPSSAGADAIAAVPIYWGELLLTFPENTMAFYLYLHTEYPGPEQPVQVTVAGQGAVSSQSVVAAGSDGAVFIGFYSTDEPLTTLSMFVGGPSSGFAIGEFGIYSLPAITSPRADVGVVIYGGWGGMPVQAWVGGTVQPTLHTAPNHEGEAAALFTFWPPENTSWQVSVAPELPAGLDPALWELKLVGIRRGTTWGEAPASGDLTIARGSQIVLYYQLVSLGG
ncbi:MAG: hypothetical protein ACYCYF_08860 [Anaerolineae bacterium]